MRYRIAVSLGKTLHTISHLKAIQSIFVVAQSDERHTNKTTSVLECWYTRDKEHKTSDSNEE